MADIPLEELAKRLGGEEERAEAVHALPGDWRQQQGQRLQLAGGAESWS